MRNYRKAREVWDNGTTEERQRLSGGTRKLMADVDVERRQRGW